MRYLFGYGYLFLVFVVMTLLQKIFRLSVETSRKLTHIAIGYTWVILYRYFILPEEVMAFEVLVLPISFIIINAVSYRYKILTLIERTDDRHNHPGTVYYAIAITLLMAFTILFPITVIPSGIAVFALSLGDGSAALVGSLFGKKGPFLRKDKSLQGTIACFFGATASVYLLMLFVPFSLPFYAVLLLGAATALLELCGRGFDNFTITFGITALATILLEVTV